MAAAVNAVLDSHDRGADHGPAVGSTDIVSGLRSALRQDRWVRAEADAIDVALTGHGIILTGTTRTLAAKRRALILAGVAAGSLAVIDRLRRRPAGVTEDTEIAREACAGLEQEPEFHGYGIALAKGARIDVRRHSNLSGQGITLAVDDGAIELAGSVGSFCHRRIAEVICWRIDDCQFVDNELEVLPRQDDSDEELSGAVRLCLDRDPVVEADRLRIHAAAAVVRIDGSLRTESERSRMIEGVWSVPGVADIDDLAKVPAVSAVENESE